MKRPIASVHVDIAEFMARVSDISADSAESLECARSSWLMTFARALSYRDPKMHPYAAKLLAEVEEYRIAETERKKANAFQGKRGNPRKARKSEDSADSHTQSRAEQSRADRRSDPIQGEGSSEDAGDGGAA